MNLATRPTVFTLTFALGLSLLGGWTDGRARASEAGEKSTVPSDAEIRRILVDRIDVQHRSVGIVVGIISPEGRRVISYGKLDQGI
ncbi:MAG TPA: hypothetical protein VKA15_21375 [Isosphaeraceae bacterium]|nr:hypothetical protein [Isosphaeraceae bacterium]